MTNNVKSLIDDYGAVGDGVTDDTIAVQNALNAGGALFIPVGTFKVTSPVIMTKTMKITGAGSNCIINGVFSSVQTGAFKIALGSDPNRLGGELSNFNVTSNNGAAVYVDLSSGQANYINRWVFRNMVFGGGSGSFAFVLNNPTNNDGFFCSEICDNIFFGGLSLSRLGDSVNIERNTITGPGPGIVYDSVNGANMVIIRDNNITSQGRAISVGAFALDTLIENNNIEFVTGSTDYCIVIDGAKGVRCLGNSLNGHSLVTGALIGMNNAQDTVIDENRILLGAPIAVANTSSCLRTRIGQRNLNSCTTFLSDQSTSTIIEGSTTTIITTPPPSQGTVSVTNLYNGHLQNSASFSFPSVSLGTEDTTRQIFVSVWQYSVPAQSPTVTIGGVNMPMVVQSFATSSPNNAVSIFKLSVPTGTSGNIVVSFAGGSVIDMVMSAYSVIGASSTVSSTATTQAFVSNVLSDSISIPANGAAIGACQGQSFGTYATTWANMTKDYDLSVPHGGGTHGYSCAHTTTVSAETPSVTASVTPTAVYGSMAIVALAPA